MPKSTRNGRGEKPAKPFEDFRFSGTLPRPGVSRLDPLVQ
jgi:hypothetical protein